jgi:hypothetical protein
MVFNPTEGDYWANSVCVVSVRKDTCIGNRGWQKMVVREPIDTGFGGPAIVSMTIQTMHGDDTGVISELKARQKPRTGKESSLDNRIDSFH